MSTEVGQLGQRLIPSLVEYRAQTEPHQIWAYVARSAQVSVDGFREVTFQDFANAINRAAWWLEDRLGKPSDFETIAYLGPSDIRYYIFLIASVKVGYKIFFLSPRNDAETHLYLLRASRCRVFLCPPATRAILAPVFATSLLPVLDIDSLDFWLDATPARHYPYIKTYSEAKADPHVIIHSSGSTGRPKLVVARNGQFTTLDAFLNLPKYAGRLSVLQFLNTANKIYNVFPPFHIAGIMTVYAVSIYGTASLVFGSSSPAFNTETILNVLDSSGADGAILPPSFIEPLGEMPEGLRSLSKLKYIAYAGAPLSRAAGGFLSATAVRLVNSLGSSECGNLDSVLPDREDYDYLYWPHEHNHLGIEWRPTSDPDVFAQVFVRDKRLSATQGVFHTFPDLNEYATSDLFRRHPTKLDHWLYEGRLDDIIVFTTGEKMNPLHVEDAVRGHPFVSAALVVGQHRFQPALLVELEPEVDLGQEQATALRNAIWEIVRQANAKTPAYGQIAESLIMFCDPGKRFLRSGKASIQRKQSLALFEVEIDALYDNFKNEATPTVQLSTETQATTVSSLTSYFERILNIPEIAEETDLFLLGLDSLRVISVARMIQASLKLEHHGDVEKVSMRLIYSHPTIASLSKAIHSLVHPQRTHTNGESDPASSITEKLYTQYTQILPTSVTTRCDAQRTENLHVILTGSTGSLGVYILEKLIKNPKISHISCLNRPSTSNKHEEKLQQIKNLITHFPETRIDFLTADLSAPFFGLNEEAVYYHLVETADHIIHNAWMVDFNKTLSSFEPLIHGVANLIKFSVHSPRRPHIFFVSSIGTVQGWRRPDFVPEEPLAELSNTRGMGGYSESKLVASRLLQLASERLLLESTVCRVGQIAGPSTAESSGVPWNKWEWLPSLVASSKYLGVVPENLGNMEMIDWVPVDLCAEIIVELVLRDSQTKETSFNVCHLVNPRRTRWQTLSGSVANQFPGTEIVPLKSWVERLKLSIDTCQDVSANPAMKLIDFYETLLLDKPQIFLDTQKAGAWSETLRSLQAIQKQDMERWLWQWKF